MLNFEMTTTETADGVVLELRGDLDIQTVEPARAELARIEQQRPAILVLDLSKLAFLDSTGMALVAGANDHASKHGYRFVIVRPLPLLSRPFELVGFTDVWETVASARDVLPELGEAVEP